MERINLTELIVIKKILIDEKFRIIGFYFLVHNAEQQSAWNLNWLGLLLREGFKPSLEPIKCLHYLNPGVLHLRIISDLPLKFDKEL